MMTNAARTVSEVKNRNYGGGDVKYGSMTMILTDSGSSYRKRMLTNELFVD